MNEVLPSFEGEQIDVSRAKLVGSSKVDLGDTALGIDQEVDILVSGRVTRIEHVVNHVNGALERVHTIKLLETTIVEGEEK